MVETPPKKVFWGCFGGGLNPFSGGTWTLRARFFEVFHEAPGPTRQSKALCGRSSC